MEEKSGSILARTMIPIHQDHQGAAPSFSVSIDLISVDIHSVQETTEYKSFWWVDILEHVFGDGVMKVFRVEK